MGLFENLLKDLSKDSIKILLNNLLKSILKIILEDLLNRLCQVMRKANSLHLKYIKGKSYGQNKLEIKLGACGPWIFLIWRIIRIAQWGLGSR